MSPAPALAADLPALAALEASFAHARWSQQAWADELANERACVFVERGDDGGVQGAVTFSHVAEVADLNRVVVAPEHRGQGLGRRLVLAGLAWASGRGAEQVMLEVDADNAPAIGLYRQVGFVTLARRANYYGAGRHALVMALRLKEQA